MLADVDGALDKALTCFEKSGIRYFQPSKLFPLFFSWTSRFIVSGEAITESHPRGITSQMDLQEINQEYFERLLEYLFHMRGHPDVESKDGIDTLILHILIELDSEKAAIAFAATPNEVVLGEDVVKRLEENQWHCCLALLLSSQTEQSARALELFKLSYQNIESGKVGAVACREEDILQGVTNMLSSPSICQPDFVAEALGWLIHVDVDAAIQIVQYRSDVSPDTILKMLPEGEIRWKYLKFAIQTQESREDGYFHTEFALSLLKAIQHHSEILQTENAGVPHLSMGELVLNEAEIEGISSQSTPALFLRSTLDACISHEKPTSGNIHQTELTEIKRLFRNHTVESPYVEQDIVWEYAESNSKYMAEEQLILACVRGDNRKVLEILIDSFAALDVSILYARLFLSNEDHLALLDMILEHINTQGKSNNVSWGPAGALVASLGDSLDGRRVVQKMPLDIQLSHVMSALQIIFQNLFHRKRSRQIQKALHSSRMSQTLVNVNHRRINAVLIHDASRCSRCHVGLSNKVFVYRHAQQIQGNESDTSEYQHGKPLELYCLHCSSK